MKKNFLTLSLLLLFSFILLAGCKNEANGILVDSISISKKNLYLAEGQTAEISAQVYPFNADNQNFEFASSDENVVVVDNGFVIAKKAGNAVITVTSQEGGFTDTCNVLVTTVKNNLALNNYNNMNMPFNVSQQNDNDKKTQKASSENFEKLSQNSRKKYEFENVFNNKENTKFNIKTLKNRQNYAEIKQNYDNFDKFTGIEISENTTNNNAKKYIDKIKNKTLVEVENGLEDGKRVFEEVKSEFEKTVNDFNVIKTNILSSMNNFADEQKENAFSAFGQIGDEINQSIMNIQQTMWQNFDNIQNDMKEQLENIEQNFDDYVVETKDINGVKFVVIRNKTSE